MKVWIAILTVLVSALGLAVYANHQEVLKVSERLESARRAGISSQTERCAAQAGKVFTGYGYNSATTIADFRNHYNAKLNKCFMSIDYRIQTTRTIMLLDAYERRGYGEFDTMISKDGVPIMMSCVVDQDSDAERHCKSEEEYNALTAKYWRD